MNTHIYKDANKEWRWNIKADNGKIVADSAESYKTRWGAERAVKKNLGLDHRNEYILLAILILLLGTLIWALTNRAYSSPKPITQSQPKPIPSHHVTQTEIDQHNQELQENIGK